jgi:hypothetical protein
MHQHVELQNKSSAREYTWLSPSLTESKLSTGGASKKRMQKLQRVGVGRKQTPRAVLGLAPYHVSSTEKTLSLIGK